METTTTAETIESTARELGLSMSAVFVPFSQSRSRAEKSPSLNWLVTIKRGERDVITTDYMAGSGHCPAYKNRMPRGYDGNDKQWKRDAVAWECENGKRAAPSYGGGFKAAGAGLGGAVPSLLPKFADVLHCLASDCDVIDAGGFEQWAGDLGYYSDSRKAEGIYRACLDTALKLRAALGEDGLTKLREACHNY